MFADREVSARVKVSGLLVGLTRQWRQHLLNFVTWTATCSRSGGPQLSD
ncbi:hypothetical protein ACFOPQ_08815 [Deinococcus antarcticus]|uniref:Uncharacterized protein n=1 Tax=Deinococcus antarcticus TaxID=1298767 RepID=A0ABV8A636_9DEIO